MRGSEPFGSRGGANGWTSLITGRFRPSLAWSPLRASSCQGTSRGGSSRSSRMRGFRCSSLSPGTVRKPLASGSAGACSLELPRGSLALSRPLPSLLVRSGRSSTEPSIAATGNRATVCLAKLVRSHRSRGCPEASAPSPSSPLSRFRIWAMPRAGFGADSRQRRTGCSGGCPRSDREPSCGFPLRRFVEHASSPIRTSEELNG